MKYKPEALASEVVRLLREERLKQNWSVYKLAGASGLAEQSIGYIEKGVRRPTFETLLKLSDALNVDLDDIIRQARKNLSAG